MQADRVASFATPLSDALAGSGYLLTGDAGVVQLDVRVFYKVTEPYAFRRQGEHVLPALDRLVTRSAVALTAARIWTPSCGAPRIDRQRHRRRRAP